PALTGLSYDGMPIDNGDAASLAFLTIAFEDMPEKEKTKVRQQLLDYCRMDTWGMVEIVRRLKEISGE
ncbi:MAG: DUF2779 domain-containing protein, partial [Dehalococcoidia bacterium]|nr:DUF2779 domain-containing protein [Dehalococcoidia bacterium]